MPVNLGRSDAVQPVPAEEPAVLLEKHRAGAIEQSVTLVDRVDAPVAAGDVLGELTVTVDGEQASVIPLVAAESVERLTLTDLFLRLFGSLFGGN